MALYQRKMDLTLDRMHRILALLDHPERRMPPVIHVAGTNGKGSTVAYLRAILEAAGLRVHVYTSPHLVRINERYRLAGELVTDAELWVDVATWDRARALLEEASAVLHDGARPPRTDGTELVNLSLFAFVMDDS